MQVIVNVLAGYLGQKSFKVFNKFNFFCLLIVVFFSLNACKPMVTFDQPQPEGLNSVKGFPVKMINSYVSADANDTLIIKSNIIILHLTYENFYLKSELDSNQQLLGDTLLDINSGYKEKVIVLGDTLISKIYELDTLFYGKRGDVLKKYKGHYLINEFYAEDCWEVSDLLFMDGNVMISKIDDPREIELLKSITQTSNDSTNNYSASKRQFREFLTSGGFGAGDIFYRIKK